MMNDLISRRDAINVVSEITTTMSVCTNKDECYGMKRMQKQAITELEHMPSAEPEHPDINVGNIDTISRQQAIEVLRNRWLKTRNYEGIGEDIAEECEIYLKTLPSVQPKRKTGRWVESNPQDSKLCRLMTCSECGKAYIVNINVPYEDWTEAHKFCVECGTKMEGGEQDG